MNDSTNEPCTRIYHQTGIVTYWDGDREFVLDPVSAAEALQQQFDTNRGAWSDQASQQQATWLAPGVVGTFRDGMIRSLAVSLPCLRFTAGSRIGKTAGRYVITPCPVEFGPRRQFVWEPMLPVPSFLVFAVTFSYSSTQVPSALGAVSRSAFHAWSRGTALLYLVVPRGETLVQTRVIRMPNMYCRGEICMGGAAAEVPRSLCDQVMGPWHFLSQCLDRWVNAPWGPDLSPPKEVTQAIFSWDAGTGEQLPVHVDPDDSTQFNQLFPGADASTVKSAVMLLHSEWAACENSWELVQRHRKMYSKQLAPILKGAWGEY